MSSVGVTTLVLWDLESCPLNGHETAAGVADALREIIGRHHNHKRKSSSATTGENGETGGKRSPKTTVDPALPDLRIEAYGGKECLRRNEAKFDRPPLDVSVDLQSRAVDRSQLDGCKEDQFQSIDQVRLGNPVQDYNFITDLQTEAINVSHETLPALYVFLFDL